MSILDLYNNPPNQGRQIRFKNGEPNTTVSSYAAYQKNDQTSLRNSQLHFENPDAAGFSVDGTPKVTLNSDRYFAVGERPSDLDAPAAQLEEYQYSAVSDDLKSLSDLGNAAGIIRSLER